MPYNIARQVLKVDINEQDPRPYYINVTNRQLIDYDDALGQVIFVRPYDIYTARITQSGVLAPVAQVLEDNTGLNGVWSRVSIGVYRFTFNQSIQTTRIFIPGFMDLPGGGGNRSIYLPISDTNGVDTRINVSPFGNPTSTGIQIEVYDNSWVPQEWSTELGASGLYFEFRVY